uniref:Uncharacterized protein n=1 Tax=Tanacetum cinerariifolium TaxID=118510 RepID=A0A6L2M0B0_TANCI|nr:hypothetical protein [Tanacetum cinerariifolium]
MEKTDAVCFEILELPARSLCEVECALEEDATEPGVVLGRSFMHLTRRIADFGNGIIIIYLELDPFLDSSGGTKSINDLDFEDIPEIEGVEILPFFRSKCHAYRIYKELGSEELKNVNRGITMLNHSKAEPMGLLKDVLCHVGCGEVIDEMLTIKLSVAGTDEEIFTLEAWTKAFNIDEPIYSELYHEFYSTYEFDEVCADDELRTKKIIKFRLYGHAFSWTLLEFARRLEFYHSDEINEEGFDVYFQGGLPYFEGITQNDHLWLVSEDNWIITKIAKRKNLMSDDVLNSLSALIYCRALDTITVRELIDSEGRLIHEVPELGVTRVSIPRPPRASMQDLYEKMGSIEIRRELLRGWLIGSLITETCMLGYLST